MRVVTWQVDVLEAVLDLFYTKSPGEDGTPPSYNRSDPKKTLMLHYAFVTALLLEDCDLQPAQVPIFSVGCRAWRCMIHM